MLAKLKTFFKKFDEVSNQIYDTFFAFVRKHVFIIALIILLITSFLIRWCFIDYHSGDMDHYLVPWMDHIKGNGGFLALKSWPNFSNSRCDYPLAYVNLLALMSYFPLSSIAAVKFISFFFDYALAFGVFLIVKEITHKKSVAYFSLFIMFFMPTDILNSALWGQCEALWACCIIYAIYFILKNKNFLAMFILGLSVATKIHTVFFFPTLVWLFLVKKVKLREMLLIPLAIFITIIPGLIVGVNINDALGIYATQMGQYKNANYGSANMYAFLQYDKLYDFFNAGAALYFGLSILGMVLLFLFYYKKGVPFTAKNFIHVAAVYAILSPYVMPHMHERYFFFADVMMILYTIITRRRKFLPITMQLASIFCYANFLFGHYHFGFLGFEDIVLFASLLNLFNIFVLINDFKYLETNSSNNV